MSGMEQQPFDHEVYNQNPAEPLVGDKLDEFTARVKASAEARYAREKERAHEAALRGDEAEVEPGAFEDLGYSVEPDPEANVTIQLAQEAAEAEMIARQKAQEPKPWDLSEDQLKTNRHGAAVARDSLRAAGVFPPEEIATLEQMNSQHDRRKREAELAGAAKLAAGVQLAEEAEERATDQVDDGPLPIEGAINTPEEARRVAQELRDRKP